MQLVITIFFKEMLNIFLTLKIRPKFSRNLNYIYALGDFYIMTLLTPYAQSPKLLNRRTYFGHFPRLIPIPIESSYRQSSFFKLIKCLSVIDKMRGVFTISYSFFSPSTSDAKCLSPREAFFKRTSAATLIQFHSVCKNINGCIFIEKYDRLAWVGQDMSRSGFEMFLI